MLLTFVHLKCFVEILEVHSSRRRLIGHHLGWILLSRIGSHLFGRNLVFLRSQRWKMPLEHYIFAILILGKTMRHTSIWQHFRMFEDGFHDRRLLGRDWKREFEEILLGILKDFSSTGRVIWSVISCYLCLPIIWFCVRTSGSHENGTPN